MIHLSPLGRSNKFFGAAMQMMYTQIDGTFRQLKIPDAHETVVPSILWGAFDELFTPAFWKGQAWQHGMLGTYQYLRIGQNLIEELAACLLGGFGMKAEIGIAAFNQLRIEGLLSGKPSSLDIEKTLMAPLTVNGNVRKYRFPKQKAQYLAACLNAIESIHEPEEDAVFRDMLTELPGIGMKTASWIVRNYRASNSVAIIDVHILKAGKYINLFPQNSKPERNYRDLEASFLDFALALNVDASVLDGLMWDYVRRLGLLRYKF